MSQKTTEQTVDGKFKVGDGASYIIWTDREPVTIIRISKSGRTLWAQQANYETAEEHDYWNNQKYTYSPNPDGEIYRFSLRASGVWKMANHQGSGMNLSPGYRRYQDPCF